jgi:hypothetical protein
MNKSAAHENGAGGAVSPGLYDTNILKAYVNRRRTDAMVATSEAERAFYLEEAERYERRLCRSLSVPVIHVG